MTKRLTYIAAFCLYMVAILYLCLMKPDNLPEAELFIFGIPADKLVHLTMFLPFPILIYMIFLDKSRSRWRDIMILTAAAALGTGAAFGTEYLQSLTQYRSCDIHDTYADLVGLALGCALILAHIIFSKKGAKNRK